MATGLCNDVRNIVLVGRTGNGKSATGNSILGRQAFKSKKSAAGVTQSCELQGTVLSNGQVVNVIDTPGLFDSAAKPDFIGKEIMKCVSLAKEGIHAFVVVFSARNRFSKEEEAAIYSLQSFFGDKITDYMIIVFTGGDDFDEDDSLEEYLNRGFPETFKEILRRCKNRVVLFDNKTKNETNRVQQVQQLLCFANRIIEENGGQPYSDAFFTELKQVQSRQLQELRSSESYSKKEMAAMTEQINKSYEEQLKRVIEMVEVKLKETTKRLEQQLAEEQVARMLAEQTSKTAQEKSNYEISKLTESLDNEKRANEKRHKEKSGGGWCTIL